MTEATTPIRLRPRDRGAREAAYPAANAPTVLVTCGDSLAGQDHLDAAAQLLGSLPAGRPRRQVALGRDLAFLGALAGAGLVIPALPGALLPTLSSVCAWLGLPFLGPGPRAATVAVDAELTSRCLEVAGLDPLPGLAVTAASARGLDYLEPVLIRPVTGAGPYGVTVARDLAGLREGVAVALAHDPRAWVEAIPQGRRLRLAVARIAAGRILVGGADECAPGDLFGPDAAEASAPLAPASLTPAERTRLELAALSAYEALDLTGVALVDFVLDGRQVRVGRVDPAPVLSPSGPALTRLTSSGLTVGGLLDSLAAGR